MRRKSKRIAHSEGVYDSGERSTQGDSGSHALPHELRASNPWLPLDWRWQIALHFAGRGETVPAYVNDAWVRKAWRCLTYGEPLVPSSAQEQDSAALNAGNAQTMCPQFAQHAELMARILAGQTNDQIAARMHLRAEAVEAFEREQFAVRDRLLGASYIRIVAIGDYCGDPHNDLAVLWKEYGYFAGPFALDWLVDAFRRLPAKLQAQGILGYTSRGSTSPPLLRLLVLTRTMTSTPSNILAASRRLLREFKKLKSSQHGQIVLSPEQLGVLLHPSGVGTAKVGGPERPAADQGTQKTSAKVELAMADCTQRKAG